MISTIYNNLFNLFSNFKLPNILVTRYNISKKIQFNSLIGIFLFTFYLKILLTIELFYCIIYPLYYSFNIIENNDNDNDNKNKIIKYWTIFSIFKTIEYTLSFLGDIIFFYNMIKSGFLIFLVYNNFAGSCYIYDNYIKYYYLKYNKTILEFKKMITDIKYLKIENKS